MKYLLITLLIILCGCQSNTGKIDATASFAEKEYNFGVLEYKKPVQHRVTVKNIGKSPLIINNVETSCGCTVPDWSKKPIKPGKEGEINITYDSDFPGKFRKTITVFYNGSESPDTLIIKGEVKYPEETNNL
jgi:hypothetical protein